MSVEAVKSLTPASILLTCSVNSILSLCTSSVDVCSMVDIKGRLVFIKDIAAEMTMGCSKEAGGLMIGGLRRGGT